MLTQQNLHDLLDYDSVTGVFKWKRRNGRIAGCNDAHGYIVIRVLNKLYKAHRLAWLYVYGVMPTFNIDHINGRKSDNSISNLRDVDSMTNKQNMRIKRIDNTCGYLGVSFNKKLNKYTARIQNKGIQKHLGVFTTPEAAHDAYVAEKRNIHNGCTI